MSNTRILIVDDDLLLRRVIGQVLTQNGYEVEIAKDGAIALDLMSTKPFDLVLSDISMPIMNGYELLEHMNKNNINIPVAFLSGYSDKESELKALEMGAAGYIAKPIVKDVLLLELEKILNK